MTRYNFQRRTILPESDWRGVKTQRGFTMFELLISLIIISILTVVLLNRVWFYQEQIEKASMMQLANTLQGALFVRYSSLLAQRRDADIKALVDENPMHWLMQAPANYAGEFAEVTPNTVPPGSWAFDLGTRELIYVPEKSDFLAPGKNGFKWVRYKAQLIYYPMLGKQQKDGTKKQAKELSSVFFKPVENYHWF